MTFPCLEISLTQSRPHQSLYKEEGSTFPKISSSLVTHIQCHHRKGPFYKHSGENHSLWLSCPVLTQPVQILLFPFINKTRLLLSPNHCLCIPSSANSLCPPLDFPWWLLSLFISPCSEFVPGLLAWLYPVYIYRHAAPRPHTHITLNQKLFPASDPGAHGCLCLPFSSVTFSA